MLSPGSEDEMKGCAFYFLCTDILWPSDHHIQHRGPPQAKHFLFAHIVCACVVKGGVHGSKLITDFFHDFHNKYCSGNHQEIPIFW